MSAIEFSEFAASNKETWQRQLEKELYGKQLVDQSWEIADSVYIQPYYTSDEIQPGLTGDLLSAQRKTSGWLNTASIRFDNPAVTNSKMRSALSSGADGIILDLGTYTLPQCELTKTLHVIRLSDSFIYFSTTQNPELLYLEIARGAGYYLKGGIANDPVAQWMRGGQEVGKSLDEVGNVLRKTKPMKDFRPFSVESHIYHNAGANPIQELAFMISALVTCTDHLTDLGISPLHVLNRFFFSVSIGTEYLTEIAKLRALRLLYRKITRAYKLPDELCHAFIHTESSSFYHGNSVPHTNMIRVTSEAMSAVNGGCDALTVHSYNQSGDEFSNRIANNVSLLISNETNLRQVADPAAGSYLLDRMSLSMADAAWEIFLRIEEQGDIMQYFRNGFVKSEIESSWKQKIDGMQNKKVMVGVNKYNGPAKNKPGNKQAVREHIESDQGVLPNRNLADEWLLNNR